MFLHTDVHFYADRNNVQRTQRFSMCSIAFMEFFHRKFGDPYLVGAEKFPWNVHDILGKF